MSIQVNEMTIKTDAYGFLCDSNEWEPTVAETMARNDGIVLTELHWKVLRFLRDYYTEYQIAPDIRMMAKSLGGILGSKKVSKDRLIELFSQSPDQSACRYAGLPRPVKGACV